MPIQKKRSFQSGLEKMGGTLSSPEFGLLFAINEQTLRRAGLQRQRVQIAIHAAF